ncbi:MAG: cytidylate kinase-like family protein [Prevotella sp.]|nr:cytidylate kinase-like family protein [Prevotella sp.]
MNTNEQFVITINRELGSGGRTVGRKLAEKLGVDFYDKALIKALEEKYHLTVEEIERLKGRKHNWWADFKRIIALGPAANDQHYYKVAAGELPDLLTTDEMFEAEQEILLGIAQNESCVIAGRSGFYVFREHPNHLNVLIQAPMEQRLTRVMVKQEVFRDEAQEIIKKVDTMRENYINKYTDSSRYDTRNYDLVINMAGITEDQAVELIMSYIKMMNSK